MSADGGEPRAHLGRARRAVAENRALHRPVDGLAVELTAPLVAVAVVDAIRDHAGAAGQEHDPRQRQGEDDDPREVAEPARDQQPHGDEGDGDDEADPGTAVEREDERHDRADERCEGGPAPGRRARALARQHRDGGKERHRGAPLVRVCEERMRPADLVAHEVARLREGRVDERAHEIDVEKACRHEPLDHARPAEVGREHCDPAAHDDRDEVRGDGIDHRAGGQDRSRRVEDVEEDHRRGHVERSAEAEAEHGAAALQRGARHGDPAEEQKPDREVRREADLTPHEQCERQRNREERPHEGPGAERPPDRETQQEQVERDARAGEPGRTAAPFERGRRHTPRPAAASILRTPFGPSTRAATPSASRARGSETRRPRLRAA